MSEQRFRVVTYNVHRCIGLDRRLRPDRIADVLREINADVIALQEVVSIETAEREKHQAQYIAEELGMNYYLGETRRYRGGAYGNVLLTRLPVRQTCNYDISVRGREERGCLRADVELNGSLLHVFNVHLGTAFLERRHQARRLIHHEILLNNELNGPRLMLGDFNEWIRGLATRLLTTHLESINLRNHLRRSRTYPGVLPFLHLDHIYYDRDLELESVMLHRSRKTLLASDHLPLVGDFRLRSAA